MKVVTPFAGETVDEVCRRIYFMLMDSPEPIVTCFNETTIIFVNDTEGLHHKDSIDSIEVEYITGLSDKELMELDKAWWEVKKLS